MKLKADVGAKCQAGCEEMILPGEECLQLPTDAGLVIACMACGERIFNELFSENPKALPHQ